MPMLNHQDQLDRAMLQRAALIAYRAAGRVEPDPMVGCIIARPDGTILGRGHHRTFGGPHAEAEALNDCRRQGHDPRSATAYVTLEPCNHFGRTPPCSRALIDAGISRVVAARRDENPIAAGGFATLRAAGIDVVLIESDSFASRLSNPFTKYFTKHTPWVIAKWAQTLDGKLSTRTGDSKWISNEYSRRWVHRWRGRVDAILTGIGTVLADDPLLTARNVPIRRIARRIVLDPSLRIPESCALLSTLDQAPLSIAHGPLNPAAKSKASALAAKGVELIELPEHQSGLDLAYLLRHLAQNHQATNVLAEAGPRLIGSLLSANLVDELRVFIAPKLVGDPAAGSIDMGQPLLSMADAANLKLDHSRILRGDLVLRYRRAETSLTS